jgi:NADPH:quinone reductase-like Zn-dependent oxidoreductase
MKAIVRHEYGSADVLSVQEIDTPNVGDGQVLVRVHATSVNPIDWHSMRGAPYLMRAESGWVRPKNTGLGADFAGRVEEVGANVTRLAPGDEVYGISIRTHAEFVVVSEQGIAHKPVGVSFEEAAAVPVAGLTALQGLRDKGRIQAGQAVLVNGASGGVGTFAVQIAKSYGAEVTGVCSTRNLDLVRSIGADHVVDYTREDLTRSGRRFDLILDAVGNHSISELKRVLAPDGYVALAGAPQGNWIAPVVHVAKAVVVSKLGSQKMIPFLAQRNAEDLTRLKELIEAGEVTPIIDRRYSLAEVPEAIRYLEEGRARGKVVISV